VTYDLILTTMKRSPELVDEAQRLRHEVFSADGEGLSESAATGRDADIFDNDCDHLMVKARDGNEAGRIIATYRLQTGMHALRNHGYYTEQEFDMSQLEKYRAEIVELGRAAVHKNHRQGPVLMKLLAGIASYAVKRGGRYLVGPGSIPGKENTVAAASIYHANLNNLSPLEFRVTPLPHGACPLEPIIVPAPKMPKLMKLYMTMGAKFCGPPFIDGGFNTIDFFIFIDLVEALLSPAKRFFYEIEIKES
jgi:putative hemolysin